MSTSPPHPIADDLRRFVLTSIPSVSYLEAMLLFSRAPHTALGAGDVARLLYLPERSTTPLLNDLCAAGVLQAGATEPETYRFAPRDDGLEVRCCPYDSTYRPKPMRDAIAASLAAA